MSSDTKMGAVSSPASAILEDGADALDVRVSVQQAVYQRLAGVSPLMKELRRTYAAQSAEGESGVVRSTTRTAGTVSKMNRPSWDTYFMEIAKVVSTRSTCPRAQVGALIVKDRRIISTGYNGSPSGESHCMDAGCIMTDNHCQRTVHAEVNAIGQAAQVSAGTAGTTMYVFMNPFMTDNYRTPTPGCRECEKAIRAAGIRRVLTRIGESVGDFDMEQPGVYRLSITSKPS